VRFRPRLRPILRGLDLQQRVEVGLRVAIGVPDAVRPGEVLPVVDREVQVVQRVVRGPVDDVLERVAGDHVGVVNEDAPKVDGDEEEEVECAVEWEEEDK